MEDPSSQRFSAPLQPLGGRLPHGHRAVFTEVDTVHRHSTVVIPTLVGTTDRAICATVSPRGLGMPYVASVRSQPVRAKWNDKTNCEDVMNSLGPLHDWACDVR
jgi:hypothetical protein